MSFFSTRKPLSEWKWYVRKSDHSIHQSADPVQGAIEVDAPPNGETDIWDWENNIWKFDVERMRRQAKMHLESEMLRLSKFSLIDDTSTTRALILKKYISVLKDHIENIKEGKSIPSCPPELEDKEFFK